MNLFVTNPKDSSYKSSLYNLNRNINLTLGIYYLFVHTLATFGVNPKISIYILVGITICKFLVCLRIKPSSNFIRNVLIAPSIFVMILLALWIQLPAIALSNKYGVLMGMVTTGNNDVASYAMVGQEFLRSGFSNSGHYLNYDMNFQAKTFSYQAPNILTSMFSTILNVHVWQVMTLVMVFAVSLSILSLASILETMNIGITRTKSILVGAFICATPLATYVIGNYFVAQILALSVTASLVSLSMRVIRIRKVQFADIVYLSGLTVLASMTYPHLLLPFLFVLILVSFAILCGLEKRIPLLDLRNLVVGLFFGLFFSSLVIWKIHKFIIQTFSMSGNGWPLPIFTPQAIILNRFLIGIEQPEFLVAISWFLFATITLLIVYFARRPDGVWLFSCVLLFGFGFGTLLLILIRDLPVTNYTNWKLIAYVMPLFLVILAGYLTSLSRISQPFLILVSLVLLVTPAIDWSSTFKGDRGAVTQDMQEMGSDHTLSQYSKINIDVNPWFETMALASIVPIPNVSMINSNYYFQTKDESACSIVRRDNRNYGTFVKLNKTYGLTQSKDGSCGVFALPEVFEIRIPSSIDFSSGGNGANTLVSGWSSPEAWGIWSEGKESVLRFKVIQALRADLNVTLSGSPFESPTGVQEVEIVVNGQLVSKISTPSRSSKTSFNFSVPKELISRNDNRVELLIKVSNPTSPLELGISNDPRKLGFGLVSVSIKESA
jgi:hypothetical protein